MIEIRKEHFVRFKDVDDHRVSVVRAELDCDSAADLPEVDGIEGRELLMGSIAWDISTGDFYGLSSDGSWYKQDGSGAYDPDAEVSLNAAPSFSVGNLNRPAVQPIQLAQPSFIPEGDTDDSEDEETTEEETEVIEDEPEETEEEEEETEEEPEEETEVIEDAEPLRNLEDI